MLRVIRQEGLDQEVRVPGIFAEAGGRTHITQEFQPTVRARRRLELEISFSGFEAIFMQVALGEIS